MMWNEFEELAGYQVTFEDYTNIIEPMYLAIPESISKMDFIKMLDRKRFEYIPPKSQAELDRENELKAKIKSLQSDVKWYQNRVAETKTLLENETDAVWVEQWKNSIKGYRRRIKECKIEIQNIKWILE